MASGVPLGLPCSDTGHASIGLQGDKSVTHNNVGSNEMLAFPMKATIREGLNGIQKALM